MQGSPNETRGTFSSYDVFICGRTDMTPNEPVGRALKVLLQRQPIPRAFLPQIVKPRFLRSRLSVYRDVTDSSQSSAPDEIVQQILKQSRWLVVVCTPSLNESDYCNDVIRRFVEHHGSDRMLLLLVEGEPDEAFPSLGTVRPGDDGAVMKNAARKREPLAADIRAADSRGGTVDRGVDPVRASRDKVLQKLRGRGVPKSEQVRVKLVAAILGCKSPDELVRRHRARLLRQAAVTLAFLLIVAGAVTWRVADQMHRDGIRNAARHLLDGIDGQSEYPTAQEYAALKILANADLEIRLRAIEVLLDSRELSTRAVRWRLPYTLHAVVQLDSAVRDRVGQILSRRGNPPTGRPAVDYACAKWGAELAIDQTEFQRLVASNYVSAMKATTDLELRGVIDRELVSLGSRIPRDLAAEAALQIAESAKSGEVSRLESLPALYEGRASSQRLAIAQVLIKAIEACKDAKHLVAFCGALSPLLSDLPAPTARETARKLGAAMERVSSLDSYTAIPAVMRILARLGTPVPAEHAFATALKLVPSDGKTYNYGTVSSLVQAFTLLTKSLSSTHKAETANGIANSLDAAAHSSKPYDLVLLCDLLAALADGLPDESTQECAQRVLARLDNTHWPNQLNAICRALAVLHANQASNYAAAAANRVFDRIEKTVFPTHFAHAPDSHSDAADQFALLSPALDSQQVEEMGRRIVTKMDQPNIVRLVEYSQMLAALGKALPPQHADAAARFIVTAMQGSSARQDLAALSAAVVGLAPRMSGSSKAEHSRLLSNLMHEPAHFPGLTEIMKAATALGMKLSSAQANQIAAEIAAVMAKTTDVDRLADLGGAAPSLATELSAESAAAVAKPLADAMARASTSSLARKATLVRLAAPLVALRDKLPAEQADLAGQQLVSATEDPGYITPQEIEKQSALAALAGRLTADQAFHLAQPIVSEMRTLPEAWKILAGKLNGQQASAVAGQIVEAMNHAPYTLTLASLGEALAPLVDRIPVHHREQAAECLISAMRDTKGRYELAWLGAALAPLERRSSSRCAEACRLLADMMPITPDSSRLSNLTSTFGTLAQNLLPEQAAELSSRILLLMTETTHSMELGALREAQVYLIARLDKRDVPALLKSLVCVGATRDAWLAAVASKEDRQFRTVWDFVAR